MQIFVGNVNPIVPKLVIGSSAEYNIALDRLGRFPPVVLSDGLETIYKESKYMIFRQPIPNSSSIHSTQSPTGHTVVCYYWQAINIAYHRKQHELGRQIPLRYLSQLPFSSDFFLLFPPSEAYPL